MSAPQYTIVDIDLAIARAAPGERIVDVGVPVTSWTVLQYPAGAVVSIAVGQNKLPIPLVALGQEMDEICPPCDEGIFITNPAGAGTVRLYFALSNAPVNIG